MAPSPSKRRRRPGQACDSCHRKKTRCYWRSPACADCIRLGVECTFGRNQALPPGELPTRSTPIVSERVVPDVVDGNPGFPQNESPAEDPANGSNTRSDDPLSSRNDDSLSHPLPRAEIEELLGYYFTTVHQTFPIISRSTFTAWSNDGNPFDTAFKTCFNSLLCASIQHAQLSDSNASPDRREVYWKYLGEALSNTGNILIATPSIRAVRALAALVACAQHTNDGAEKGHAFLAVAIRFAYSLNLHHLDEEVGLRVVEQLERIRLFWCLYILDRSTSLTLHLPPMIDDRDVCVLTPKKYSDDKLGMIHALNSDDAPNLFTARERLARISSSIWADLYTFSAQHAPRSTRQAAHQTLSRRLLDWKDEWFPTNFPPTEWPKERMLDLVHLQFEYFLCLLKADPETFPPTQPKNISLVGSESEYIRSLRVKVESCTAPWLPAARETLRLATVIRKGGLNYLQYASHYIVPGILILSASASANAALGSTDEQRAEDRRLAGLWMEVYAHIARSDFGDAARAT